VSASSSSPPPLLYFSCSKLLHLLNFPLIIHLIESTGTSDLLRSEAHAKRSRTTVSLNALFFVFTFVPCPLSLTLPPILLSQSSPLLESSLELSSSSSSPWESLPRSTRSPSLARTASQICSSSLSPSDSASPPPPGSSSGSQEVSSTLLSLSVSCLSA